MTAADREERFFRHRGSAIGCTPAQIDRDRILASHAFRRLGGITQVVASGDGGLVHNRLTHVLTVAEIGRRIAERMLRESKALVDEAGGLDPDVVEAACLAHDLGHPPFGHLGETTLDKLIREKSKLEGFEGNAQSFRIVTKLAICRDDCDGLNLTRATLDAILKYPHVKRHDNDKKYSVYRTENEIFTWVRKPLKYREGPSLEAEIMDWADDIAYSVYDMEDFYRAGKIPLDRIRNAFERGGDTKALSFFYGAANARWEKEYPDKRRKLDDYKPHFEKLIPLFPKEPFFDYRDERRRLRRLITFLVARFIKSLRLVKRDGYFRLERPDADEKAVTMLKELTWVYVLNDESLRVQRWAQEHILDRVFHVFLTALKRQEWVIFPRPYRDMLENNSTSTEESYRILTDFMCSLTERQVTELHQRLSGITFASAFQRLT